MGATIIYYKFEVLGKVVPYVRMTQRSKYISKQAKRYLDWKEGFGWSLKAQMKEQGYELIPKPTPLYLRVVYELAEERRKTQQYFDLTNAIKGVEDAAQGVVYENDSEVDVVISKRRWGADEYKIILLVWGVENDPRKD